MIHPVLSDFHPTLSSWFHEKFGQPTDIQARAWPVIGSGVHTLISSPTGSGKTLAALLPIVSQIAFQKHEASQDARPGIRLVYIAPLKALNNDIYDHLQVYLNDIAVFADKEHLPWPDIRCAVRTGDTSTKDRSALLRNPPDILMTTPESLYILLTSKRGKDLLQTTSHVVVDEIHDMASSKRGIHLSLSLERLAVAAQSSIQRVGVSATQKPLSRVAQYLGGFEQTPVAGVVAPRRVQVVEGVNERVIDVKIVTPEFDVYAKDKDSAWIPILKEIFEQSEHAKRFIIFVNNRRLCERLTLRLNDYVGDELARAHHGSVSKEVRLQTEQAFKAGELRCIIATSSLELGIDIGDVDLVMQMDSPKSPSSGIQRFGRAGHYVGGHSRGVIVAKNRFELAELCVMQQLITQREIEEIYIPRPRLDILAQHIVSMVATEDWDIFELFRIIRQSDIYKGLEWDEFIALLRVISGYYPFVTPLVTWSSVDNRLTARPNTQLSALLGAGTIPQSTGYPVYDHDTNIQLGELDEEFVNESRTGDVFQLGASPWMIRTIRHDRVTVSRTSNRYSEIPFWKGEANGRSFDVGERIGVWMEELEGHIDCDDAETYLQKTYQLDGRGTHHILHVLNAQRLVGPIPTHRRIIVEHYLDDVNQMHLVVHCLFGRRLNRTWMLALEQHMKEHLNVQMYSQAKDNGIHMVFSTWHPDLLHAFQTVTVETLDAALQKAIPASPMFSIALRHTFETALLFSKGRTRTPIWLKRKRTEELLKQARPYTRDFPFIREALEECMSDHLDVDHLKQVLRALEQGEMDLVMLTHTGPSPLAREFLAEFFETKLYEADVLSTDVIESLFTGQTDGFKGLVESDASDMTMVIPDDVLQDESLRLAGVYSTDRRSVTPETVYRHLKRTGDATTDELVAPFGDQQEQVLDALNQLVQSRRACSVKLLEQSRWICADEADTYEKMLEQTLSMHFVISRWMENRLSFRVSDITNRYPVSLEDVAPYLDEQVQSQVIVPSVLCQEATEPSWMSAAILNRLQRRGVSQTRKRWATEADAASILRVLLQRQHVHGTFAPVQPTFQTAVQGRSSTLDALKQVIETLQGVLLPVQHWETVVFPTRLPTYRKEDLDALCASGEVVWIGRRADGRKEERVAFFLASSVSLYTPLLKRTLLANECAHPEFLRHLESRGASFLARLGADTGLAPSELLSSLFDLVWEGRVSNDQFSPLRVFTQKKLTLQQTLKAGVGRWYTIDSLLDNRSQDNGFQDTSTQDTGFRGSLRSHEQGVIEWTRLLLKRNGLVAKSHVNEEVPYSWEVVKSVLQHMEDRGEVVRGLFVPSIPSVQFASIEVLSELSRTKRVEISRAGNDIVREDVLVLSSVDPANPFGDVVPWPKMDDVNFARKSGNVLVLHEGKWILWIENKGRRIHVMDPECYGQILREPGTAQIFFHEVFMQLFRMQGMRKTTLERWNGETIVDSQVESFLRELGAQRQGNSFVLWKMIV